MSLINLGYLNNAAFGLRSHYRHNFYNKTRLMENIIIEHFVYFISYVAKQREPIYCVLSQDKV